MAVTDGRSTSNSVGNTTFTDLSMTHYPKKIDSRVDTDAGYNQNMQGFLNVGDSDSTTPLEKMYNMAEHVNALADAVMAVQRVLGIEPHLDKDGLANAEGTLDGRIDALEDPVRYDSRYGGTDWSTTQTLVAHTHTGELGGPSKINLGAEVQGILAKSNVDLAYGTGITGTDISMSSTNSKKINEVINDKLSITQGGSIESDLSVKGKLQGRVQREWNHNDVKNGTSISTTATSSNVAFRGSGTGQVVFINEGLKDFEYGKYVIGVRVRTSLLTSQSISYIRLRNYLGGQWVENSRLDIAGADFSDVGKFQTFFLVCDVEGDSADSFPIVEIGKTTTTISVDVDIDYAFITPVHPAIFDK